MSVREQVANVVLRQSREHLWFSLKGGHIKTSPIYTCHSYVVCSKKTGTNCFIYPSIMVPIYQFSEPSSILHIKIVPVPRLTNYPQSILFDPSLIYTGYMYDNENDNDNDNANILFDHRQTNCNNNVQ